MTLGGSPVHKTGAIVRYATAALQEKENSYDGDIVTISIRK
jgi:hypothetical protein